MTMRKVCVVCVFGDYLKDASTESGNGDRESNQKKHAVNNDPETKGKAQQQGRCRSIKDLGDFHNAASFG
jgi:hypothetical protein